MSRIGTHIPYDMHRLVLDADVGRNGPGLGEPQGKGGQKTLGMTRRLEAAHHSEGTRFPERVG